MAAEHLVNALVDFLRGTMAQRLGHSPAGRVQPVFLGPPADTLSAVFDALTDGGKRDWFLDGSGGSRRVVVLLVGGEDPAREPSDPDALSQRCTWDYAVTIRNSVDVSLMMSTPSSWDRQQESIANATERLGVARSRSERDFLSAEPWRFLARAIATASGVPSSVARESLATIFRLTRELDSAQRDAATWNMAGDLLGARTPIQLVRDLGLPNTGTSEPTAEDIRSGRQVIMDLAALTDKVGLGEAEQALTGAAAALLQQGKRSDDLSGPLGAMFGHLRESAGTGSGFRRSPLAYFRPASTRDVAWWDTITHYDLRQVLDELETKRTGKLLLSCTNAMNLSAPPAEEPYVVQREVRLQVADDAGAVPSGLEFGRRSRGAPVARWRSPDDGRLLDQGIPPHDRPVVYKVEGDDYRPAKVAVLALDMFECRGHARISDALSNPPPVRAGKGAPFEQEIAIPRAGAYDLSVWADSDTRTILIERDGELVERAEGSRATFIVDLDDQDELAVRLLADGDQELSSWTVRVLLEEAGAKAARSKFEALVRANESERAQLPTVLPVSSYLREIEQQVLVSAESWRGVVAGFSRAATPGGPIDWTSARLGDLPLDDVRPALGVSRPPAGYLACRDEIRGAILAQRKTIAEVALAEQPLAATIERYVREYASWLAAEPEAAAWTDCVALHAPSLNVHAGSETATSEPIALLLGPLHPLRLGWHCLAQHVLDEALRTKPCPAASVLDPHASPSVLAVPLYRGGAFLTWRAFLATGCNDPYWQLLWNREHLGHSEEKTTLARTLDRMGIVPSGITGGFTRTQAKRALDDLAAILPARATLRVGVVGAGSESRDCVDGILDWCRERFQDNETGVSGGMPASCEVFDLRETPEHPSQAALAMLSEETSERVRWFLKGPSPSSADMDLAVLDQLGALEPQAVASESRAAVSRGALVRVNIRQDLGGALVLKEARVGRQAQPAEGLVGLVTTAVLLAEDTARRDNGTTHLQFQPNQRALGQRLERSLFVAATSSQVDPACFIRGAQALQSYLWDYELPGLRGFDTSRAGYYLVAKPRKSMRAAIIETTRLVTSAPLDPDPLLDEISRRGIPVLKRMARGGGQARGELGVLLASRLLQDAFRQGHGPVRLPVAAGTCAHLVLPVDSFWNPFAQLRRSLETGSSEERPDLLVFAVAAAPGQRVQVKVTPLEIKFRETNLTPAEIGHALHQAANLGSLLERLWTKPPANELWSTCGRALLADCLDHAFRVYADPAIHGLRPEDWEDLHQRVMHDVVGVDDLGSMATVNVAGRLLVFDASSSTDILDMDGDRRPDTAVIARSDAEALMSGPGQLSPRGEAAVALLDFSLPHCLDDANHREAAANAVEERVALTAMKPGRLPELSGDEALGDAADEGDGDPAQPGDLPGVGARSRAGDLVQPVGSAIPPEYRQRVRNAFEGFIGNDPAVRRISNDLLRALIEKPPHLSKNFLLTGQPSTGKTEMARRMSSALKLPFTKLDGRGVGSRERLFELVGGELAHQGIPVPQVGTQAGLPILEYPPLVVFIDEVHLMPRVVQESLLTMLEAADRTVTLQGQVAHVQKATFIFATTRASELDAAFKSRCTEVQLREYDLAQVAEMVSRRYPGWPTEVYTTVAKLGRLVPRVALELARDLETEITVTESPEFQPIEHLEEVRKARELDEIGLMHLDYGYLELLDREGRPVGESAILNLLGTVDRARVLDEVEPYLRRLDFIRLGPRGREITKDGRDYLLARRRQGTA